MSHKIKDKLLGKIDGITNILTNVRLDLSCPNLFECYFDGGCRQFLGPIHKNIIDPLELANSKRNQGIDFYLLYLNNTA